MCAIKRSGTWLLAALAAGCASTTEQPPPVREIAARESPIRLDARAFTGAEQFHGTAGPIDPRGIRAYVAHYTTPDAVAHVVYVSAGGGYVFRESYGTGGQEELGVLAKSLESRGPPKRRRSGSTVTPLADFRYHVWELAGTSIESCATFDGLVGQGQDDRNRKNRRLAGYFCRDSGDLGDLEIKELIASVGLR